MTRPGLSGPTIVYFDDGALLGDFNKGISGPIVFTVADATKRLAQVSLNRGGPRHPIGTSAIAGKADIARVTASVPSNASSLCASHGDTCSEPKTFRSAR
jgi:hypothetical protein